MICPGIPLCVRMPDLRSELYTGLFTPDHMIPRLLGLPIGLGFARTVDGSSNANALCS